MTTQSTARHLSACGCARGQCVSLPPCVSYGWPPPLCACATMSMGMGGTPLCGGEVGDAAFVCVREGAGDKVREGAGDQAGSGRR